MTSAGSVLSAAGPPGEILLDYAALRAAAMADLERVAGGAWTDFNAHDPGITILETLCYALTDFGYRLFHPMPDLLATPPGAPVSPSVLRGPLESLSAQAVTLMDLRAVALDVPGVRNAWIEPALAGSLVPRYQPGPQRILMVPADASSSEPGSTIEIAGLHRALIEPAGDAPGGSGALAAAVAARLHAHRGLGEDLEEVVVLGVFDLRLELDVEVADGAFGAQVVEQIAGRIDEYLSPTLPRRSPAAALAETAPDVLIDGPAPTRGFLDQERLAAAVRRRAVHLSDLIRETMAVPSVRAVRAIRFIDADPDLQQPWSIAVPDLSVPRLSRSGSHFRLFGERAAGLTIDLTTAGPISSAPVPTTAAAAPDAATTTDSGRWRDAGAYRPLQADLPPAYGVGRGTLPASTSPGRRADSTRLRAYLALFDHLLASYFAQLAALPTLLSPAGGGSIQGYVAGEVPEERPTTKAPLVLAPGLDITELRQLMEPAGAPAALQRRNRILNHLLARFGEELANDPLDERLIAAKERFLQELPELAAGRGSGVDLMAPPGSVTDPPLVRRLLLELDIVLGAGERLLLVEHVLLRPWPEDALQTWPLLTFVQRADPFSLQVTLLLPSRFQAAAATIEPRLRAAVPAHLAIFVQWLEPPAMAAAIAAYEDCITNRRQQLRRRYGLPEDG